MGKKISELTNTSSPNLGSAIPLEYSDANYKTTAANLFSSASINNLGDVQTSGSGHTPANGDALVWNSGMSHWMPGTVSSSVASTGMFTDIRRFRMGYVGNKYATSGYTIDGPDNNFDGVGEGTINGGIGGGTSARDGNLITGKYLVLVYYPGVNSNWYHDNRLQSGSSAEAIRERAQWTTLGLVKPWNTVHNNASASQNPPCDATYTPGAGGWKYINYIYGFGQSFCIQTSSSTTWIRCRSDGKVDYHLRSGNTAGWSYSVMSFFKYE